MLHTTTVNHTYPHSHAKLICVRLGYILLIMKIKYGIISDVGRMTAHYDGGTTAALIGAGATILSGATQAAVGGKMNKRAVKWAREQNRLNQEFAREQNQWNLDFWHKANVYNSPLEQRRRLEAAGYNPVLLDLNGNLSETPIASSNLANQVAPMPNAAALGLIQQGVSNIMSAPSTYLQNLAQRNEIQKLASENEQIKQNTELLKKTSHLTDEQAKEVSTRIDEINARINQMTEQNKLIRANVRESNERSNLAMSEQDVNDKKLIQMALDMGISLRDIRLRERMTDSSIASVLKDIELKDAEIQEISKKINNLSLQAFVLQKQITAQDLQNAFQRVLNKYAEDKQSAEISATLANAYGQSTSSIGKTLDFFGMRLNQTVESPFGQYQSLQHQVFDRVNNRFGVSNKQY